MSFPIQIRRASTATLTANNPVLRAGEGLYEKDTGRLKIGDGQTAWNDLPYFNCGQSHTSYRTMTAIIDENNSDPATCVSYTDDAANMTPGSDEWDAFFGHYPVMLLNGVEGKKLQRNNFAKHQDGTAADITSGAEGDVMICFPRRGLHMERDDANWHKRVIVSMTDNPSDSAFEYYAHSRGIMAKKKFYYGAYIASVDSNKLWSLANKTLYTGQTQDTYRTAAHAKGESDGNGGSGYDLYGFYQLTFLQAMYVLKYNNLDSQTAVGMGYCKNNAFTKSGGTEIKGMDWGETTGKQHVKLFGIEDMWGEGWQCGDGLFVKSGQMLVATENFNNEGTNYSYVGNYPSSVPPGHAPGFHKSVQGTSACGFVVKEAGGSATTYYTDRVADMTDYGLKFGLHYNSGNSAGMFAMGENVSQTTTYGTLVTRIMYL